MDNERSSGEGREEMNEQRLQQLKESSLQEMAKECSELWLVCLGKLNRYSFPFCLK